VKTNKNIQQNQEKNPLKRGKTRNAFECRREKGGGGGVWGVLVWKCVVV